MTTALDRLAALKSKDRGEIVGSSALAEWEKTILFRDRQGRAGTADLTEIVLAQCGKAAADHATPLLAAVQQMIAAEAGSQKEQDLIQAVRLAAAKALTANDVPFAFGKGNQDQGPAEGKGTGNRETKDLPVLEKFAGQVLTRESFLAIYVKEKAKGQTASVQLATEDENAAPVERKIAVGKKLKFRPHQQVEATIPQYLQPSKSVILAADADEIRALTTDELNKMFNIFAHFQMLMATMPKDNQLLEFLINMGVPGIEKSNANTAINGKVKETTNVVRMMYHAANFLFMAKDHICGGKQMLEEDKLAMEVCGRAICEYAAHRQVSIGAKDVLEQIRQASGIHLNDHMQKYATLDRTFTAEEASEITAEVKEKLEMKKLLASTQGGSRSSLKGTGTPGVDANGSRIPLCKVHGDRCYSYQKGIRCQHGKQNNNRYGTGGYNGGGGRATKRFKGNGSSNNNTKY